MDDVRWWQRQYEIQGKRLAELEADKRQVEHERDDWKRIAEDAIAEVKRLRGTTE